MIAAYCWVACSEIVVICEESWCSVPASWPPALTTPSRAPSLEGALASELQALQKAESWLEMPEVEGSSKADLGLLELVGFGRGAAEGAALRAVLRVEVDVADAREGLHVDARSELAAVRR